MSRGFLEQMARSSAERVALARARVGERELRERAYASPAAPRLALSPERFDLIAEVKFRSPAAGRLAAPRALVLDEVTARAREYAEAGAAAISVLTEPTRFDGALEHLRAAAAVLRAPGVPAMRKDFLVDPYQVLEARAAGAGGVLIVLRMLSEALVEALLDCARELGLFALLEAFDERDIERAQVLVEGRGARAGLLVGVNCRDLDTLEVVPGRLEALAPLLPTAVPRVAESGVASGEDAARIARAGYDLALVGSALMSEGSPLALARKLLAAGRAARS
jgi:indole-3-glycerol phosphate synthase